MSHHRSNPLLRDFGHLIGESGLYPAFHIDVFWNVDDQRRVKDTAVVFVPRHALHLPEMQKAFAAFNAEWRSDLGNSCEDWLTEGGLTPSSVFGTLLAQGFVFQDELDRALREFAMIRECDWARDMIKAFRR